MKNTETATATKKEQPANQTTEAGKIVANHKKAADHFTAAAKSHTDAAKHHKDGHHEKAAKSTVEAQGHASIAKEAQKENAKHHASKV